MVRRARGLLIRTIIAVPALLAWGVNAGCNPSFIDAVGGNPVVRVETPDGYMMILLMNQTQESIQASVDVFKDNGSSARLALSTGPLGFYANAQDCGVTARQLVTFTYSTTGGAVDTAAKPGVLTADQQISCGKVIAVTASGQPPIFSVQ